MHRESPAARAAQARRNLRNEKVSLTTRLITKLLTNPLAQSRSTEDAGDQLASLRAAPPHRPTVDGMEEVILCAPCVLPT